MAATKVARTAKTGTSGSPQDEHEHVMQFSFSSAAQDAIASALKGLNIAQQDRVLAAVDVVCGDVGDKVARVIERNVIANANQLLAVLAPPWACDGRWEELKAILLFLEHLDVPVQANRLAKAIEKAGGAGVAGRWRKEAGKGGKRKARNENREARRPSRDLTRP